MSKIVHFEIPVDEPDRASAFYRDVLGWEVSGYGDEQYWLVRAGADDESGADGADDESGADGALIARGEVHQSPVVIAGVDDLDDALGRVKDAGGLVVQGRLAIPGIGWSAYVRDPEGNVIGLFQPDSEAAPPG